VWEKITEKIWGAGKESVVGGKTSKGGDPNGVMYRRERPDMWFLGRARAGEGLGFPDGGEKEIGSLIGAE